MPASSIADPLQNLRDVHIPLPAPFWPLAPGWYLLLAAFICVSLMVILIYLHQTRVRRFALKRLRALSAAPFSPEVMAEVSILLRRASLSVFPRHKVAGLHGDAWLRFLNESGETDQFTQTTGRLLTEAPYQRRVVEEAKEVLPLIEKWIKKNV